MERFGWPPRAFLGRELALGADMLLVTSLRWSLEKLLEVHSDAVRLFPDADEGLRRQMAAARQLLNVEPITSATSIAPQKPELLAIRREGAPWGAVASVMKSLRDLEVSLDLLVNELILPDEEIRWRLFHLAVLGQVLIALRQCGCSIKSRRPIGGPSSGPTYTATDEAGECWDLWFEASGLWSYSGVSSPYAEATKHVGILKRGLGADLLLIRPPKDALILECKYSANEDIVGRDGYLQATAYATEIRTRLAEKVIAITIGPEGVVRGVSFTNSLVGQIGSAPPSQIEKIVGAFLIGSHTNAKQDCI